MKYLWIVLLLSATAFGQNSYGTDFVNLHCTAPDPSAPPNFGDAPKPGLVPTSAATGNAVLYCDASSSSLKVSFSGSAYAGIGGGGLPAGLSFVAPTLTVSTAGSGNGTLALSGNTSGTATFTSPAVAGTVTNSVVMSNVLQGPSGAAGTVTYGVAGSTNNGLFSAAANDVSISAGGTRTLAVQANAVYLTGQFNNLATLHTWIFTSTPTIAAAGCGGAAATIATQNGTAAFTINVGTTPTSACTVTMPSASTAWVCNANDLTTQTSNVFLQKLSASSQTSITVTNYSTAAAATAFVASDTVQMQCTAY